MTDLATAFNPLDPSFHAVAESSLDQAHAVPVFFAPAVDAWVVSRYADVDAVLKDTTNFSSRDVMSITDLLSPEVAEYFGDFIPMEGSLIGVDEPAHARLRRVLSPAFTPARVSALGPSMQRTVDTILDGVASDGAVDLQSALSFPLAITTITRLIGIPDDETAEFRHAVESWEELAISYISGYSIERQMELARPVMALHTRVNELLEERRRSPQSDLLSDIVAGEAPDQLTPREMLSLVPGLFLAGYRTTADALGLGMYHLLTHREHYEQLVADPARAPAFVEEMVRLDGPVFGIWRHVIHDTAIGDVIVPQGSKLYVSYWGANLDSARYALSQSFNPNRDHARLHLAFGRGIHACIGAPLARLELSIALESLARRFPNLDFAPGFTPEWVPNFFLRGMRELRLVW